MSTQTTIPARFNGPPASGNGGYSCGVLAAHIAGPARIRLHVPPPLDTALRFVSTAGGAEMYDGDTLVASGEATSLQLDVPNPPSNEEALAAMDGFPFYEGHAFPTCFVCGPERAAHDGLDLFPGPIADSSLWACLWKPTEDLLDAMGNIRPEILWSALDCPGYFAATGGVMRPALLGELTSDLRETVSGIDPLVVYAWSIGEEGRKVYAGTAVSSGGKVVACASSTWITLKT